MRNTGRVCCFVVFAKQRFTVYSLVWYILIEVPPSFLEIISLYHINGIALSVKRNQKIWKGRTPNHYSGKRGSGKNNIFFYKMIVKLQTKGGSGYKPAPPLCLVIA